MVNFFSVFEKSFRIIRTERRLVQHSPSVRHRIRSYLTPIIACCPNRPATPPPLFVPKIKINGIHHSKRAQNFPSELFCRCLFKSGDRISVLGAAYCIYLYRGVTRHQLENLPWRDTMMVGNRPSNTTGRRKNLPDFVLGVWSKKEAVPS